MLKPPLLQPFCFGVVFSPFAGVEMAAGYEDVTNDQKLSGSWPVGTVVRVSDGFVVSGANDPGFYAKHGTSNGRDYYTLNGADTPAGDDGTVFWDGAGWFTSGAAKSSLDDVAYPWLATNWLDPDNNPTSAPAFTHPAVQRLDIADPSDESHWTNI